MFYSQDMFGLKLAFIACGSSVQILADSKSSMERTCCLFTLLFKMQRTFVTKSLQIIPSPLTKPIFKPEVLIYPQKYKRLQWQPAWATGSKFNFNKKVKFLNGGIKDLALQYGGGKEKPRQGPSRQTSSPRRILCLKWRQSVEIKLSE